MRKWKLKKNALIGIYIFIFALTGTSAFFVSKNMKKNIAPKENIKYVNQSILEQEEVPVINQDIKIIKPYTNDKVQVGKSYYDYQADNASQEKSILYHENTYIQNSGMDFVADEIFEVVAILDGTVISVKDDELLGKIIEIKHDNDLISNYQSLSEATIKKNDTVKQGQVIGKSGINQIDKDLGNHLHFELYKSGQVVNPSQYFDKNITETKDNQTTTSDTDTSKKTE